MKRRWLNRLLVLPLAGLPGWALAQAPQPAAAATQTLTLTVAVDTSLALAMQAVARTFEATRPGLRVRLVPGAPGSLLEELGRGSAFDVLAGSDAATAASGLQRRLLLAEARSAFASNRLVLVVPAGLALPVRRLADLARPEVQRIAMGRQGIEPAGTYAREAIQAQRLWPALQAKMLPVADEAGVLARVLASDVDAGFVYASSAAAAPAGRLRVVETLATATPIRYQAHASAASRQPALAAAFVQHLRGEAAQAEFQRLGFGPA